MGRSKFPGRPSKHCHRKRVNVLASTGELNQEGDSTRVTVIGACKENKQDEDLSENEGESTSQTQSTEPLRRRLSRKLSTTIRKNGRQRNFITKIRSKTTLKNSRVSRNNLTKRHARKDTANYAGKFVLPTRSVHSSRVIKPNKRFIDLNETLNVKKRSLVKRPMKQLEDKSNTPDSDSKDKLAFSNGHKVILRQARLKLPNQVSTQGPFSSNLHNGPGTIICGVCGAVRYYRFMKQARKFNIYSCESCRKFITKQIKRQNVGSGNSTNVLICLTGQGTCYIPPVERSQHWKMSKCAYRARCPACWLKMCLKAYHLPLSLKENLTQLLPKGMRGIDFSFSNLPPILWQRNTESVSTITTPMENMEVTVKQRPVRFKPLQKIQTSVPPVISDVKRQKIDLKGPRVKHVCRSASIVLGQPLAMFGDNSVDKKNNTVSDSVDSSSETRSELSKLDSPGVTDEEIVSSGNSCKSLIEKVSVVPKKERTRSLPIPSIPEPIAPPTPPPKGILLDHSQELNFENRYKLGFSLMISKEISISAMCFWCGSTGFENMLVCCMCCEPYHTFCIEEYGVPVKSDNDWICMRCAPCQGCKGFDRTKISCPKCLRIYHNECFSNREDISSPKLICKECTKCQDCRTATAYNLSSFPGNLPLCLNCLDKRKVGKHCPICRHSFEESSSKSKMLECLTCKKWVHADCEKLTSEQYDILKLLPTSSNFTCSQCLGDSNASWRSAVRKEMYRSFNRVLRLLLKNKSARIILKKVGVKGSLFRKYMLTKSLDIDNNNYNKDIDKIYSFEESERLQKEPGSCTAVSTLQDIKYRLCDYNSVKHFNNDMLEALKLYDSEQVLLIYRNIFQSVFSWYGEVHEKASFSLTFCHSQVRTHEFPVNCPLSFNRDSDNRQCELCQKTGDGLGNQESRLLYCGNNSWVHANCAFWSTNVYEQVDNHLQNVILALETSRSVQCGACDKFGASIQCHLCRTTSYHFMCARKAEFYFVLPKKACFCSKHLPETQEGILKVHSDFEINRSLFIEQSPQKDILRCEPDRITCIIGSLCIKQLGKIDPVVSDTAEAIIPAGFLCSKLFWSTKNPWKLVTYIISTSIQNPNCTTLTVDKNFTVDHSLGRDCLEKALKELKDWCHIYEKRSEDIDSEDEEEKNGTELLSPELTDTILEDLPHDILDGISVQDIFPNFSYEDMLCLDNSNSESITDSKKISEEEDSSKSDNLHRISSKVPPLSLTVSCKVDPPVTKKRKLSKESTQHNLLLLQLDGTFDDSASECGSPTGDSQPWGIISEEPVTCEKCQCTYRTQASYKRHLDSCEVLCTSESDSENVQEHEVIDETAIIASAEVATTVQVNETSQPVLIQAFESYQSQVHTSVVNVVPEPPPPQQPTQQSVSVQPTITIQEPAPISISVPLCMGTSLMQPSIEFQQPQTQQMTLQTVPQVLVQRPPPPLPRRDPVVIQQIQPAPASGFVPFVDAFGQTQQYVQLTPQVQPQLLQIRPDGNVIGILPSIQPTTVIVQQPQQLVLDSSGTFGWAQQPQPQIYYGFETIVQNTVMQSQQFLPTPVPGVLTANSSYSTTTQVFQTSKLEPVLDVSSNSFVLVNSSGQLEMPQQFSQASPAVVSSQTPTLIYSSQSGTQKPLPQSTQNCISLPANTTLIPEQSVPMNIVPPRPKTSHSRPMNRVLPMLTSAVKIPKKMPADATKMFSEVEKPSQIKLDEKLVFSKDLLKVIDNTKVRNRKFEVLDYKLIHPQPKIFEKPFKEFEPVEKLPKLSSTYEPLKEIEKVEREMFEKPMLKEDKFLKSLPRMETFHIHTSLPQTNLKPEIKIKVSPKENNFVSMENSLQTLESSMRKMASPALKLDSSKGNLIQATKYENEQRLSNISDISNTNVTPPVSFPSPVVEVPKPSIILNASIQDKALDMPPLDDLIKPNEPKTFSLQEKTCKVDSITKNSNTVAVPPLLSVKPQPVLRPTTEPTIKPPIIEVEKPKTSEPLERKPPPKKEPEPNAAPAIMYTVENKEEGFKCSSTSITDCWAKVLEAVQAARAAHNMPPLPTDGKQIKSVQITGLKSSHVKYLVEQLPGASKCVKYKPLFKFTPHSQDLDVCSHGFGAVRCQPHKVRNNEPYDIFSWLSSKHREPFESLESQTVQSRRVNNFPMAMKFKNLKLTSKYSVGVYRSRIHGKGLFCLRDIEPGEMVIEYAGEVIRSILTDKREKYYNSKGIGCYMFRVDDNCVVDATMKGNAARFINHSCDPNCYSKVVEIMGHKHIIIFALRRILSGEELTYDYKFPFEEDKIPCTCGARRCRKFLN